MAKLSPIVIMNTNYERLGLIENADIIWNTKYYTVGDFELYCPATDANISLLQKNYYVVRDNDDYIGIIEKIEIEASVTGGDYITATGRFAESLLTRRVVNKQTQLNTTLELGLRTLINDHFINPTDTDRKIEEIGLGEINNEISNLKMQKQITGTNVETAISEACQSFAVGYRTRFNNGVTRTFRNIRVGDNLSGATIYFDFPDNICSCISNGLKPIQCGNSNYFIETKETLAWNSYVAKVIVFDNSAEIDVYNYLRVPRTVSKRNTYTLSDDFGIVTTINTSAESYKYIKILASEVEENCFRFELYKGIDRSYNQTDIPRVVFGEKYDNLTKSNYIWDDKGSTNFAYVAGEGEGVNRTIKELDNTNGLTGINRKELWVDARDLQTNDGSVSDAQYTEQLMQRGNEKMVKSTENFSGEVMLNNFVYKKDFFVGDVVSVILRWGTVLNLRIIEVLESEDNEGYKITPVFADLEIPITSL